ncbi:MAG: helix-hairpin-helix domain-containing protein, partial [Cyclobacteriaceae bacterium]|nr:helix-hairpin-helix domain-containing protein [Cyclobacteriaceae bacterium]
YEPVKNFTLHTMLSSRGRDGKVQDTVQNTLSSFNSSGFHRTPSELANRNIMTENNIAVVANYKNQSLDAGLIFHTTQFSIPIFRKENQYNQFTFQGNENTNFGAFLNYSINNVSIFSEFVQTNQQGQALVAGMLASLNPKLDISMLYRKFDRNFYSFYSNALAENSIAQNESGFYWGWKYSFNKKYSLAGYIDLFQFPWLKFGSYAPSEGSEWLIRFNYKPTKTISIFLQAREEIKQRNTSADVNLYLTDLGIKRNYWINLDYSATSYLSFKSRVQFSTFDFSQKSTQGVAVMQDASFDWRKFSISGRYVLFDTDDFNNRLYAHEQDVWLAFTFPAYNGRGVRHFLLLQYRLSEKINFWVRWTQTRFTDRDAIGSSGEAIIGNTRNDVRFQVRMRF